MDLQKKLLESFESEDDLAVVLRAHIVIENYLRQLVCAFLTDKTYLEKANLEYFQLVQLAFAFGLQPRFESCLKSLGKLRNDFAHNYRAELSKSNVNNLYETLSQQEKESLQSVTSKVAKDQKMSIVKHKDFGCKQQFVNIVVMVAAALHKACQEAESK